MRAQERCKPAPARGRGKRATKTPWSHMESGDVALQHPGRAEAVHKVREGSEVLRVRTAHHDASHHHRIRKDALSHRSNDTKTCRYTAPTHETHTQTESTTTLQCQRTLRDIPNERERARRVLTLVAWTIVWKPRESVLEILVGWLESTMEMSTVGSLIAWQADKDTAKR
jgi:hypothetical protein